MNRIFIVCFYLVHIFFFILTLIRPSIGFCLFFRNEMSFWQNQIRMFHLVVVVARYFTFCRLNHSWAKLKHRHIFIWDVVLLLLFSDGKFTQLIRTGKKKFSCRPFLLYELLFLDFLCSREKNVSFVENFPTANSIQWVVGIGSSCKIDVEKKTRMTHTFIAIAKTAPHFLQHNTHFSCHSTWHDGGWHDRQASKHNRQASKRE